MGQTKIRNNQIMGGIDGWIPVSDIYPFSFTLGSTSGVRSFIDWDDTMDMCSYLQKGMKIQWTQNSTVKSAYVIRVEADAGLTHTETTLVGDLVLNTTTYPVTNIKFSMLESPFGFPTEGFTYTPTISTTSNAGTFTKTKFKLVGSYCFIKGRITYANNLSSGNLTISLPITMSDLSGLFPIGFAHYFNSGVADARCFTHAANTTTMNFYYTDGVNNFTGNFVNSGSWSSGDWLEWSGFYMWS